MDVILEYVRSFLTLFLLTKVLLYLVPKNRFSKYIAFFSGVILALGLMYPVLHLFGADEKLLEKIQYETWEEELAEVTFAAEHLKEENMNIYQKNLKRLVETELSRLVEEEGYQVKNITISLTKDYEIEKINVVITERWEEEILVEEISVSGETQAENKKEEAYQVLEKKIMDNYGLAEEQLDLQYE